MTGHRFLTGEAKYYPAVLFAIDSLTGRLYQIRTNQGDSAILLIEGTKIYYRVNDQILSAPIQGNAVGSPTLLARDEELRDAHWAFTDRQ
jgi:hypothetical protein